MSAMPPLPSARHRLFEYLRQEDAAVSTAANAKRFRSRSLTPQEAEQIKAVALASFKR